MLTCGYVGAFVSPRTSQTKPGYRIWLTTEIGTVANLMTIIVWKCELCGVTVPLTDNGATVRKCTGGHPDMTDTSGRRWTPDHWPLEMERIGELASADEVDEDVSGWKVLRPRFPSPAESARLADEEAAGRRSTPYRYLDYPGRMTAAYRATQAVEMEALVADGLADVASDATEERRNDGRVR